MLDLVITADLLEQFKTKQDIENAQTYLARIVYSSLPTEYNYEGRLAFVGGRLYGYTNNAWKGIAFMGEGGSGGSSSDPWYTDADGNLIPNPSSSAWRKDTAGNLILP